MKRSELNDEAKKRLDDVIEKWVEEIENLGKGEEWGLDKNLKKQIDIERKNKKLVLEIITDEKIERYDHQLKVNYGRETV